jgi:serine protease Do
VTRFRSSLLIGGILSALVIFGHGDWSRHVRAEDPIEPVGHAKALSRAFRNAAEATAPAVVTVIAKQKPRLGRTTEEYRELLRDPRFRRLFPDGQLPPELLREDEHPDLPALTSQVGSGVVIDGSGLILTNNHVVQDADEIIIRLPDGQEIPTKDVKRDELSDLAVVRIATGSPLKAVRLGDSDDLEIGDWVIAIGSPFELEATVSAGIISGKGRGIDKIRRGQLIQTDAAINPGNSGGPLVNLDGEVVGINTAIATSNGGYQGVGFAIPINRAKWVSAELLKHGKVRRAYLGIEINELTADTAAKLKLPPRHGVLVIDVRRGGPAERSGIQVNDVIIEFAGQRVRGPRDLQDAVEQKPIDSQQPVKVVRGGQPVSLQVKLNSLD